MKKITFLVLLLNFAVITIFSQEFLSDNSNNYYKSTTPQVQGQVYFDEDIKVLLFESFKDGLGQFTCFNTVGPLMWRDSRLDFLKISGNNAGVNHTIESWLISPSLNFSKTSNHIEMSFQHAGHLYGASLKDLTLWITDNYNENNFGNITWKQLIIPIYMDDSWNFVSSGAISFDEFVGKPNVRFAFRYVSSEAACATWQLKNIKVIEVLE